MWTKIDKLKSYGDKMMQSEILAAMQFPIYDFRYKADPDSPFQLYNCLKPQLKEDILAPKDMLAIFQTNYVKDNNLALSILA